MTAPDWHSAVQETGPQMITIRIRVEPGSSRSGVGPYDPWRQRIHVRVGAPATGGKANREVADLLGKVLGVPSMKVRIITGATSRRKTVKVDGLSMEAAMERLEKALGRTGDA